MKIRNIITCLIVLLICIFDVDYNEYSKLKHTSDISIKKEDLPEEFSDNAYKTILQFIQKTRDLDYEWLIYFDYITGEILKCARGESNNVQISFEDDEFEEYNVASIHNHPKKSLSPPSGKNFGILTRDFEDYELIAGFENFWILKAKGVHKNLCFQLNSFSDLFHELSFQFCSNRYGDEEIISRMHDIKYGSELLNYINNKNIDNIQLIKKEYVTNE